MTDEAIHLVDTRVPTVDILTAAPRNLARKTEMKTITTSTIKMIAKNLGLMTAEIRSSKKGIKR